MKKTRNGMRITGLLLTMVMLVALLGAFSLTASAAEGTAIDLSSLTETYVISNSGEYIFIGSGCYGIKVASGNPTIVLNNANITVGEGSAIDVASGSNATIFVLGDNTIDTTETEYSDVPCGGIFVAEGGTVNITSNGTDNILRARGTLAAAIGGKYVYAGESYNAGSIGISNVTIYAYTTIVTLQPLVQQAGVPAEQSILQTLSYMPMVPVTDGLLLPVSEALGIMWVGLKRFLL